jgi:hypothetical protein
VVPALRGDAVSLTTSVPNPHGLVMTAIGQTCFYCHEPTSDPAVLWDGATGAIYLHPVCVAHLTVRLYRDLHELDCPDYYARLRGQRA